MERNRKKYIFNDTPVNSWTDAYLWSRGRLFYKNNFIPLWTCAASWLLINIKFKDIVRDNAICIVRGNLNKFSSITFTIYLNLRQIFPNTLTILWKYPPNLPEYFDDFVIISLKSPR